VEPALPVVQHGAPHAATYGDRGLEAYRPVN
jgi:hypothetical protein